MDHDTPARLLWQSLLDRQGYPNELPTWGELDEETKQRVRELVEKREEKADD